MRTLLVILALLLTLPATAQTPRISAHLMLARMCAHESSLPVLVDGHWMRHNHRSQEWGGDCYLIHTVILRGATRLQHRHPERTLQQLYVIYANEYSHDRISHPPSSDRNAWAADLRDDGHEPARWHGVSWDHFRPSWAYVYEFAGRIVRTTLAELDGPTSPFHCDEPITDWGSEQDRPGALRRGLVEVHCDTPTGNIPFRRP